MLKEMTDNNGGLNSTRGFVVIELCVMYFCEYGFRLFILVSCGAYLVHNYETIGLCKYSP